MLVQCKVQHAARLGFFGLDALKGRSLGVSHHRQAARDIEDFSQGFVVAFQLVDCRVVDLAHQCHVAQCRRDDDHIAVNQLDVTRAVAACQKSIQVEFTHQLTSALQLNPAHRTVGPWPTRGQQATGQGGNAAQAVAAGSSGLTDHVDSDATQARQGHTDLKVFVVFGDGFGQNRLGLSCFDTHHGNSTHARDVDRTVAVDGRAHIEINGTPATNRQLIAHTQQIIATDRRLVWRCKPHATGHAGGRPAIGNQSGTLRKLQVVKERQAKQRQFVARGFQHKALKLVGTHLLKQRYIGSGIQGRVALRRITRPCCTLLRLGCGQHIVGADDGGARNGGGPTASTIGRCSGRGGAGGQGPQPKWVGHLGMEPHAQGQAGQTQSEAKTNHGESLWKKAVRSYHQHRF